MHQDHDNERSNAVAFDTFPKRPGGIWLPYRVNDEGAGLWYRFTGLHTTMETTEEDISLYFDTFGQKKTYRLDVLIDTPEHSLLPFRFKGYDQTDTCPDRLFIVKDQTNLMPGAAITAVRINHVNSFWRKGIEFMPSGWQDWLGIPGPFYLSKVFRMGWELFPTYGVFDADLGNLKDQIEFKPLGTLVQDDDGEYQVTNDDTVFQFDPKTFQLKQEGVQDD